MIIPDTRQRLEAACQDLEALLVRQLPQLKTHAMPHLPLHAPALHVEV